MERADAASGRRLPMALPGMARPIRAFRRSPSPLPAPDGTGQDSSVSAISPRKKAQHENRIHKNSSLRDLYPRLDRPRLEQDFNSLDAQYDASQAYIRSQAHAGWTLLRAKYDDGGFSGGNTDRPALQRLLEDIRAGKIDVIVVYKVDRLTRSLADFAKLVELFDEHNVRLSRSPNSSTPRPQWAG